MSCGLRPFGEFISSGRLRTGNEELEDGSGLTGAVGVAKDDWTDGFRGVDIEESAGTRAGMWESEV